MSDPRSIFPVEKARAGEQLYFGMIDRAIEKKENVNISNGEPAHAVYLLNKFLSTADRVLNIHAGALSRQVEDENGAKDVMAYADPQLAESAIAFLQKENSKLSVVLADDIDVEEGQGVLDHPLIAAISEAEGLKGTLAVARARPEDCESFPYHFLVMDGEAWRLETEPEKAIAMVNFGDQEFAEKLDGWFQMMSSSAEPLLSIPHTD